MTTHEELPRNLADPEKLRRLADGMESFDGASPSYVWPRALALTLRACADRIERAEAKLAATVARIAELP